MKNIFNKLVLLSIIISTPTLVVAQEEIPDKQEKPNILVFMVDQLIPMNTSAYGNNTVKTPNIDKLADSGVVFKNTYSTCPVCVAARYSLLTGMYLATHKAFDNGSILETDIPTHNHYLNIAGYETALSGKAHFIGPDQLHGFTRRFMTNVYPTDMKFMPQRDPASNFQDLHPKPIAIDYIGENVGPCQEDMLLEYDERAVFHAIRYLAEKRSKPIASAQEEQPQRGKTPFFLQVSLNNPHEPFLVYQKYWDMYEGVDIPIPEYPENLEALYSSMDTKLNDLHGVDRVNLKDPESLRKIYRAYYASVSYIDDKLGEVLDALDQFGLRENTIIVFLSDHGDMLGQKGMVQKRGFYEYSSRIPLIISFPEYFKLGKENYVCNDPVSIVDVAPTILEMAEIKDYLPMDGKSLIPQLQGENELNRFVFSENYSEGVLTSCVMVRQGDYKLTYIYHKDNDPEIQLFDLKNDPDEWSNLAGNKKYSKVENNLINLILSDFDMAELDKEAQLSFERRRLIYKSRKISNAPSWDYLPKRDVENLYWR